MGVSKRLAMIEARRKTTEQVEYDTEWMSSQAPTLLEMMTIVPEGSRCTKTTTLTIFAEEGRYKVLINDRALGRKCFTSLSSIDDTFWPTLETVVTDELTDWKHEDPTRNGQGYR